MSTTTPSRARLSGVATHIDPKLTEWHSAKERKETKLSWGPYDNNIPTQASIYLPALRTAAGWRAGVLFFCQQRSK